jgi:hypothetical protein
MEGAVNPPSHSPSMAVSDSLTMRVLAAAAAGLVELQVALEATP